MTLKMYLEMMGFLNMLAQGMVPPNLGEQAIEMVDKLADALADEHPEVVTRSDEDRR
jgi:hypothetical protein